MRLVTTFAEVRRQRRGVVGLVPTMGFFHEGHLSLMKAARADCDTVLVSLFVNPLQFGAGEDLDRYPRDLERDQGLAVAAGVDVLFAPPLEEMYPRTPATAVTVAALSAGLCGPARPGHFSGVATVVAKLLGGLQPQRAYFGRKDAQQLAVIRRLVADLSLPVEVVGCPIIREEDGLALSSRNIYLGGDGRTAAAVLWRALSAAAAGVEGGERRGAALKELVATRVAQQAEARLEYAELVDAEDVEPLEHLDRASFFALAAHVDGVRLIDNVHFWMNEDGRVKSELGVRLDGPSILYGER